MSNTSTLIPYSVHQEEAGGILFSKSTLQVTPGAICIFSAEKALTTTQNALSELSRNAGQHFGLDIQGLKKDEIGKPFLNPKDSSVQLSIAHTSGIGLLATAPFQLGVDIELGSRNVMHLVPRFCNTIEQKRVTCNQDALIIWCIKEAMYKYYGTTAINFKHDFYVALPEIVQSGQEFFCYRSIQSEQIELRCITIQFQSYLIVCVY